MFVFTYHIITVTSSDIEIEKPRKGHRAKFGHSIIRLSGSLKDKTIVTDHTIRIHLPGNSGVHDLNLIYNKDGQPNLPEHTRTGVYSLLTQKRHDLVHVEPVPIAEAPQIIRDLKDGDFDLIATASSKVAFNEQASDVFLPGELQLLRVWRTGEFYTYDQSNGHLNKLQDNRNRKLKSLGNAVEKFRILPGIQDWHYSFDETANYYRKYLIQDEIESHLEKELRPTQSLPEIQSQLGNLQRRFSLSTYPEKDSFYRRVVEGGVPLKVHNH